MGDKVFVNCRAAVHLTSAGKSIAFPDVCLCPPAPPAGPIPTPLPNSVQAMDLMGGARSVLIEGNPMGKKSSFFARSTGNEVSLPTGGGILSHVAIGKAYFQSFSMNVLVEGEPAVRHMDLLTHNHAGPQPGNTPPVPWLSVQDLPAMPAPPLFKRQDEKAKPGAVKLEVITETGEATDGQNPVDVLVPGRRETPMKLQKGVFKERVDRPGATVVSFREIRQAFWARSRAHPGDELELGVLTVGFPDGTAGRLEIRSAHAAEGTRPLGQVAVTIKSGIGRGKWKLEQSLGAPATMDLRFVASVESSLAWSSALAVRPFPLADVRGVKQRLRQLGYDAGPPDASGGPLTGALSQFQADHPPLEKTGKLDARTRAVLAAYFVGESA